MITTVGWAAADRGPVPEEQALRSARTERQAVAIAVVVRRSSLRRV
jgi:hypothetical protein